MLAAMATAIAIIHVISAPINASNKPLSLTFGTRLEALLLHPQFVILLAANLCICEHFSVARPEAPLGARQDPDRMHLLGGRLVADDFIRAGIGNLMGGLNSCRPLQLVVDTAAESG